MTICERFALIFQNLQSYIHLLRYQNHRISKLLKDANILFPQNHQFLHKLSNVSFGLEEQGSRSHHSSLVLLLLLGA